MTAPGRIDVHHHVLPGEYVSALARLAAEFTFDTSRAILNPIWSGTAERCPDVRLIFSHAGGTAPFLAWRWSLLDFLPGTLERAPRGVVHYLTRFFCDTALTVDGIARYDGFDGTARRAIERDNALALLPRMRETAGDA